MLQGYFGFGWLLEPGKYRMYLSRTGTAAPNALDSNASFTSRRCDEVSMVPVGSSRRRASRIGAIAACGYL